MIAGIIGGGSIRYGFGADSVDTCGDFCTAGSFPEQAGGQGVPAGAVHGAKVEGFPIFGEGDGVHAHAGGFATKPSRLTPYVHDGFFFGLKGCMAFKATGFTCSHMDGQEGGIVDIRQIDPAPLCINGQILDEAAFWSNIGGEFYFPNEGSTFDVKGPEPGFAEVEAHVGNPEVAHGIPGDAEGGIDGGIGRLIDGALQGIVRPGFVAVGAGDFDELKPGGCIEGVDSGKDPALGGCSNVTGADGELGHFFQRAGLGLNGLGSQNGLPGLKHEEKGRGFYQGVECIFHGSESC